MKAASTAMLPLIGVDLGGTNLRAGRVVGDRISQLRKRAVSSRENEEVVIDEIIRTVAEVFTPDTAAIGIGVPSIVDVERGVVFAVENIPSWKEVHLKEILERRFSVPVLVNNDANCFALGELHYGLGKSYRHLVALTIGTGLGAGIVTNGRLYAGHNCGAGEIGCIAYKEKNIEYYCSGQFFLRETGMRGELLFSRAKEGNAQALEAFARFGAEMGHAVMTVMYAYDPEVIILGGSVASAYPFFREAMERKMEEFAYPTALKRLQIAVSQNPDIPVLGAAALFLDARMSSTETKRADE